MASEGGAPSLFIGSGSRVDWQGHDEVGASGTQLPQIRLSVGMQQVDSPRSQMEALSEHTRPEAIASHRPGVLLHSGASAGSHASGAATPTAASAASQRFNDEATSDVRVNLLLPDGGIYASLALHLETLREQSDYFFTSLPKPAVRGPHSEADSPGGSVGALRGGGHGAAKSNGAEKLPGMAVSLRVSGSIGDPEAYVHALRLFYEEEEDIPDEILALGSVPQVLDLLAAASELQYHVCVSACVAYLESVPWSDKEQQSVLRHVSLLEPEDGQVLLQRLPEPPPSGSAARLAPGEVPLSGRDWDEAAVLGATRTLLAHAVESRLGGSGLALGVPEARDAAESLLRSRLGTAPLAMPLSLRSKKALLKETFVGLLQCLWSERQLATHSAPSTVRRTSSLAPGTPFGPALGIFQRNPSLAPGTPISQAGSISRSRSMGPARRRSARRMGALPEEATAGDASDGISAEELETPPSRTRSMSARLGRESAEWRRDQAGRPREGKFRGRPPGGRPERELEVQEGPRALRIAIPDGSGLDEESSALRAVPNAVYGRNGCLSWLIGLMLEFSMADDVFKWLATDLEFVGLVRSACKWQATHQQQEQQQPPWPHQGSRWPGSQSATPRPGTSQDEFFALVRPVGQDKAGESAVAAAQAESRGLQGSGFGRGAGQSERRREAAEEEMSGPSRSRWFTTDESGDLYVVRTAVLGTMAAVIAKRLVVSMELRNAFVQLWLPILAGAACCEAVLVPAGAPLFFLCGGELDAEERAIVLYGFNELVLTLPAQDQPGVYGLWQQIAASSPALVVGNSLVGVQAPDAGATASFSEAAAEAAVVRAAIQASPLPRSRTVTASPASRPLRGGSDAAESTLGELPEARRNGQQGGSPLVQLPGRRSGKPLQLSRSEDLTPEQKMRPIPSPASQDSLLSPFLTLSVGVGLSSSGGSDEERGRPLSEGRGQGLNPVLWFSLSGSYKKWLSRLGLPCSTSVEYPAGAASELE